MSENRLYDQYALVAEFYDHVGRHQERADVAFFVEAAQNAGGPVLEIGCGTGRVLIPCARAGTQIVGIDSSQEMLSLCRERLSDEDPSVQALIELVHADMRDFTLDRAFSLVMLPFRPFQHLVTTEDQLHCLDRVNRHLVGGGRVILDVFNPSLEALANRREGVEFGDEPEFTMPDGRRVVRTHKIAQHDRFNQVNHVELIYCVTHPDGREERIVHAFRMRYLFRFELEHLLARCGFEIEQVYSGYDKAPYGSRYPGELIVVARKMT